jgi:alpha-tubulin suppressor-like RCC1 family protein
MLSSLSAATSGNYIYTDNGTSITITGYTGAGGAIVIPSTIKSKPVTSIGQNAFYQRSGLTSVTIPSSVTSIEGWSFSGCSGMTRLAFQGNAPTIVPNSFSGVATNTTVTYPSKVAGWGATFGGLTAVADYSDVLTYTTANSQVTITGYNTGEGGAVVIPASIGGVPVTAIGNSAFSRCSSLTSIMIPASVTTLGNSAFWGCSGLTILTIGSNVTTIGDYTFQGCSGLIGLTIPASVTTIGDSAFDACQRLTGISVESSNPVYSSLDGVLFNKSQTSLLLFPEGMAGIGIYSIPAGVTSIGDSAFSNCTGLESLIIPISVISIGNKAFQGCYSLTSLTIHAGVTTIGNSAFAQCNNLTSFTIPASVTTIGNGAFFGCLGLQRITIPAHVNSIGSGAFAGCSSLRFALFLGNAPTLGSSAFAGGIYAVSGFTVYSLKNATGFSAPTWMGYNAMQIATPGSTLHALSLSIGTLSPTFTPGNSSYKASVPYNTTSITINNTVIDATAMVQVNGISVASGSDSAAIPLVVGENSITAVVTAPDGINSQLYTINVSRQPRPSITTLSSLILGSGTLDPVFASATTNYSVSVTTGQITIRPTLTDPLATVKVNETTVTSGTNSAPIPLALGVNTITVLVTSEDWQTTSTYTITVIRTNLEANFTSPSSIPVTAASYCAAGNIVNLSLGFAPPVGTSIIAVKNTGLDFISGQFSNLAHGQAVDLSYAGKSYRFVANYYGGSGNDLVLQWAYQDAYAWGYNGDGRLGNNSTTDSIVPLAVANTGVLDGKTVVAVAAGGAHSLALCSDGTLVTWGANYYGQLGNNSTTNSSVPVAVANTGVLAGKTVVAVAARDDYSLALCSDGTVAAWGYNGDGRLGNNSTTDSSVPVAVANTGVLAGKTVVAVAAGGAHSLALCSDGTVAAWGYNGDGRLGNNSQTGSRVPVAVANTGVLDGKTVVAVAAGLYHSLALCSDGKVAAWGYNGDGQLGNIITTSSSVPVAVTTTTVLAGKTVVAVAAGQAHSLALCSDGTVAAWGYNGNGQLGNSRETTSSVPEAVATTGVLNGKTVVAVAAGGSHSFALCSNGTVAAWGRNGLGQLGNNKTTSSSVPVAVANTGVLDGKTVVAVAAGGSHSIAIAASSPTASTLSSLTLDSSALYPVFAPTTAAYSTSVPNSTTSVAVTPTVNNSYASVKVNGTTINSGSASAAIPLAVGSSTITVMVTAPDGTTTSTYTVTVTRAPSAVSSLAGLALSSGTLSPVFSSATQAYVANVSNVTNSLTVTPVGSDSTATLKVNGIAVASGAASTSIPLSVGANTISTVVAAQDGTTTSTYTLTVTRAPSTVSGLAGLSLSSGVLSPTFSYTTKTYAASVSNTTPSVTIAPVVTDSTATLKVNGVSMSSGTASASIPLVVGANTISTVVTAQDGTSTSTYTITVTRAPSAVSSLVGLSVNSGSLSPAFSSGAAAYAVSVANDCTGVTLTPTVTEPNATVRVNGTLVSSGSSSAVIPVVSGSNIIDVVVTAQDGTTIQTYSVMVTRPSLNATFASSATVPLRVVSYEASGNFANLSLGYAPTPGTTLTLVRVTELDFIQGRFTNLAQGQYVSMVYQGVVYRFVVNYYGGTGNDLVLQWASDKAYAWGANSYGQLGNNGTSNSSLPTSVLGSGALSGKTVVAVSAGSFHSLALCADGTLVAWGRNDLGQLGNNSTTSSSVPVAITNSGALSGKMVVAISAGYYHNLALCSDGTVAAWGQNTYGQLGDGSKTNSSVPVAVSAAVGLSGKTVSIIAAGYYHNLAQCTDGTLVAWGRNSYGQLGNNSTTDSSTPVDITRSGVLNGLTVAQFTAGSDHSLVLCTDGRLATWGRNNYGQLGEGSGANSSVPVEVDSTDVLAGKIVTSISAGGWHNLALCSDGTLAAFGRNTSGQLGDGGTANSGLPMMANLSGLGGKAIAGVQAANGHSLALCADGSIYAWGSSSNGQLGNGGTTSSSLPVVVTTSPFGSGERFMTLATGTSASHSMALVALPLSNNSALAGLTISTGSMSPTFAAGNRSYAVSVANTVTSIQVTPTAADITALVTVQGTVVASGETSATIPLSVGSNVIQVVVTAQDGTSVTTQIMVTRAVSTISTLSGLALSDGSLSPVFATGTSQYTASVANSASSLQVTSTVTESAASVKVNGVAVNSGAASAVIPLEVGENIIMVEVTAQDGVSVSKYTVVVTRATGGGVVSGYRAWIATYVGLASQDAAGDPDKDGIPNLVEYVLNGDPAVASVAILPTVSKEANRSVFQFNRRVSSAGDTTQVFQYSTDLVHWTDVNVTTPTGSEVTLSAPDNNAVQRVMIAVPNGVGGMMFGRIKVTEANAAAGYTAWVAQYPSLSDATAVGDPDKDGIPNVMEYVLHGNPTVASAGVLPVVNQNASSFLFSFSRAVASVADTTQVFQYSTDLSHWTELSLTPPTDPKVTLGAEDGAGIQSVTVTIPKQGAPMFGRLKVTQP